MTREYAPDDTPAPKREYASDVAQIPTGGEKTVPLKGELAGEPKFLESFLQTAQMVPEVGLLAGAARFGSAGTKLAPYFERFAEAVIPKTLGGAAAATTAAGLTGVGGEAARTVAARKGASPQKQEAIKQLTEMGLGLGTAGAVKGGQALMKGAKALTGAPFREAAGGLQTSAKTLAEQLAAQERVSGRELVSKQRQARLRAGQEVQTAEQQAAQAKAQLGRPQDPSTTGSSLVNDIKSVSDVKRQQRATLADQTYTAAFDSARAKQANRDFWQTSPSGQDFFTTLENKIKTSDTTNVSSAEESEIKNIINELRGKVTGRGTKSVYDPAKGIVEVPGDPIYAPADIKVVVEQLRKLREAERGFPPQGFEAITKGRAKAMAKSLEESIANWDDGLRKADQTYKAMSERLYPEESRRAKAVLARQKYDVNQLAADPVNAPKKFFQSKQGIEDLTNLLDGDTNKVAQYANQHVINELSAKKTAKEAENWVTDKNNKDWMNAVPGLRQRAEDYVKQLLEAETKGKSAEEMRKRLKTAGRGNLRDAINKVRELESQAFAMEYADPSKVGSLARQFAQKLKKEDLASPAQIADLERQIADVEAKFEGKQRAQRMAVLAAKYSSLGYGAWEAVRILGGK
jgi:hypothetical protein